MTRVIIEDVVALSGDLQTTGRLSPKAAGILALYGLSNGFTQAEITRAARTATAFTGGDSFPAVVDQLNTAVVYLNRKSQAPVVKSWAETKASTTPFDVVKKWLLATRGQSPEVPHG